MQTERHPAAVPVEDSRFEVVDGPAWAVTEGFEIEATNVKPRREGPAVHASAQVLVIDSVERPTGELTGSIPGRDGRRADAGRAGRYRR